MEMAANQFRIKFFELIDEIAQTRKEIVITKHGRPVAKVVPIEEARPLFGIMAGTVHMMDDLIAPAMDPFDCDVEQGWSPDDLLTVAEPPPDGPRRR